MRRSVHEEPKGDTDCSTYCFSLNFFDDQIEKHCEQLLNIVILTMKVKKILFKPYVRMPPLQKLLQL